VSVNLDDVPPVIRAWLVQLTSPQMVAMVQSMPDAQIDIRLTSSKGKVRRRPVITLNGGPSDNGPAGEYTDEHMA
jgi:hypothetical protein